MVTLDNVYLRMFMIMSKSVCNKKHYL